MSGRVTAGAPGTRNGAERRCVARVTGGVDRWSGRSARSCRTSAAEGLGGTPNGKGVKAVLRMVSVWLGWVLKSTTMSARSPGESSSGGGRGGGASGDPPLGPVGGLVVGGRAGGGVVSG